MQGVYVDGRLCPTKKMLKEVALYQPHRIHLMATSIFGNEFDGRLTEFPEDQRVGKVFTVVGPDPYTSRKWYATIRWATKKDGTSAWVVT